MAMHALVYFDNPRGLGDDELLVTILSRIEEVMGEAVTVVSGVAILEVMGREKVVFPVIGAEIYISEAMNKLGDVDVVMLKFEDYDFDYLMDVPLLRRECAKMGKPIIVEGW